MPHPTCRRRSASLALVTILARAAFAGLLLFAAGCRSTSSLSFDSLVFEPHQTSFPNIPEEQQKLLHPSTCFWTGASEPVALSWQVLVTTTVDNTSYEIPSCAEENGEPGEIHVNGHFFSFRPWQESVPGHFYACHDTYFDGNRNSDCRVQSSQCVDEPNPCGGNPHYNFPYCAKDCRETPSTDTTYQFAPGSVPGASAGPFFIKPTFYRVPNLRTLARRAHFDPDHSNPQRATFQWTVPVQADGSWQDNFSPTLTTTRIRAFIDNSTGFNTTPRQYLSLRGVMIGTASSTQNLRCEPDPRDATQIIANQCDRLKKFLPSASVETNNDFAIPLVWRVEISANQDIGVVNQNSNVFIEFTVDSASGTQGGPRMEPSSYDFGSVPAHVAIGAPATFAIADDFDPTQWVVESVSTTGANGAEFSARFHGSRTPPFNLTALDSASIDVAFIPSFAGQKSGGVTVNLRSSDSRQHRALSANLSAIALDPATMDVMPTRVFFEPTLPRESPLGPWRRSIVIVNAGPSPLVRGTVQLAGADAASFYMTEEDGTTPVPFSRTLAPGSAEILRIFFCPARRGDFSAEVQISGDASANPSSPIPVYQEVQLLGQGPPPSMGICVRNQ